MLRSLSLQLMIYRPPMTQSRCIECGATFLPSAAEQTFLRKMQLPHPSSCPRCRQRTRCAHINQLNLFRRRCDATGEQLLSHYPPQLQVPVFSQPHWWSDTFDGCDFGRDFDFSRPFFPQLAELLQTVPRPALLTDYLHDENCSFTNYSGRNKDCYMIFDSDESRDCYYSFTINGSRNSSDCFRVKNLELCYEAIDSRNCYQCAYVTDCEGCSESLLLQSCTACKHCILCCNLRQKEYHILNRPVSPEQFEQARAALAGYDALCKAQQQLETLVQSMPRRSLRGFQNEDVTGDYLVNCRNCENCFDCLEGWDCVNCSSSFMALKDCADCDWCGEGELLYQCSNLGYNAFNLCFCFQCLNQVRDLAYCNLCFNGTSDCFGCVGLKRKRHCILNKQYDAAQYVRLRAKIVQHMQETGEWGAFLPARYSLFPYNITAAGALHPMERDEALGLGLQWQDEQPPAAPPQADFPVIPQRAEDCSAAALSAPFCCRECRKLYKIIPQELKFCADNRLPLPRSCFYCRHRRRMSRRMPRLMVNRLCGACTTAVETTVSESISPTVYCEKCFAEALE